MSISFSLDFDDNDFKEIIRRARKLRTFKAGNEHYEDMRREVAKYLRNQWIRNFNLQGTMYGPWPALSPETLATKSGSRKLYETGKMYGQFRQIVDNPIFSGNGISWNFESNTSSGEYLMVHHFGTNKAGKGNSITIPARRVYGVNTKDRQEIQKIVKKHLSKFVSITLAGG